MSDVNNLVITGNLARDAEQRYTSQGKAVLSFAVANNTGFGDNQKTNWFQCAIFGKRAEGGLVQYLTKGQQVTISGEVSLNEYKNQSGENKASLNVFVKDLKLQGGKQDNNAPRQQQQAPQQQGGAAPSPSGGGNFDDFDGDEIPF